MALDFQLNLGFETTAKKMPVPTPETIYDVLVLGGGPAGLNAALYAKRKGLSVAVIAKRTGGQVMDTSSVENYLGMVAQSGESIVRKFTEQLAALEVPVLESQDIIRFKSEEGLQHTVTSDGTVYRSRTAIIALGSKPRRLDIPGEETLAGKGVAYCAICDGPLFKGRTVTVAGGGNSAVEAALDLAKVAATVRLVHRSQLRADAVLIRQLMSIPNIEVYLETLLLEAVGDKTLNGLRIQRKGLDSKETLHTDGLFIEIGYLPNTALFNGILQLNERGEIAVDAMNRTSLPGVFAAGDITQVPYKQIIIAAGEGAKAALSANDYLNTRK